MSGNVLLHLGQPAFVLRAQNKVTPVRHTCECVCSAGDGDQKLFKNVLAVPVSIEGLSLVCDGHSPSFTAPPDEQSGFRESMLCYTPYASDVRRCAKAGAGRKTSHA